MSLRNYPYSRQCRADVRSSSDIYSFYKEELSHEKDNFIHERSTVTDKGVYSVLFDIVDEAVAVYQQARDVLIGEQERNAWERFAAGYLAFHRRTPRYRLGDILRAEEY